MFFPLLGALLTIWEYLIRFSSFSKTLVMKGLEHLKFIIIFIFENPFKQNSNVGIIVDDITNKLSLVAILYYDLGFK